MKISSTRSLVKNAYKGFIRNFRINLVSALSIGFALFTLSLIISIVLNVTNAIQAYQENFDLVQVFFYDEYEKNEIDSVLNDLKNDTRIREVKYISREDGFSMYLEEWGEDSYLLEGFEEAIPNSAELRINDLNDSEELIKSLEDYEEIEDISFSQEIISNILSFRKVLNQFSLVLVLMMIFVTTVLTTSTIRINIHSRSTEISIMQSVGATNWFIRIPFMIEGAMLGFIGALLATGLIFSGAMLIDKQISHILFGNLLPNLLKPSEITFTVFRITSIIGVGVGLIGSIISIKKYLK